MSNLVQKSSVAPEILEKVVVGGDLSRLTPTERLSFYSHVCDSVGLNPLTRPFEYIQLNGKLTLYARRDATDQLRNLHKVSINITSREMIGDVFVVTARAKNSEGREDESTGAVFAGGLKGEALANAMMKAETKAKRRVTLSLCGLGILDETEIETIPETRETASPAKIVLPEQEFDPEDYRPKFGKYKGQRIGDLDVVELANYVSFLEKASIEANKPMRPEVQDFVNQCFALIQNRKDFFERETAS